MVKKKKVIKEEIEEQDKISCPSCHHEDAQWKFLRFRSERTIAIGDIYDESTDEIKEYACPKCGVVFVYNWRIGN
jgi:DNA-directed RNA polymerase subunit M/transcription elongation factor TFIIS